MEARDIIFNFYNHRSATSSCVYNAHEQNRAISSAEEQVSIANEIVKHATSKLTMHVDALTTAVNGYFNRLDTIQSSSTAEASLAAKSASSVASSSARPLSASNTSKAANASNSVGQILVSLKSGAGVVYSLVNKKQNR